MKKTLLKNIVRVSLITAFVVGFNYIALANPASSPSNAPFSGNVESFVNIGTIDQDKTGGLGVTTFTAEQDAVFNSVVFFGKSLFSRTGGAVAFGGPNADGISTPSNPQTAIVSVATTGDIEGVSFLQSAPLANITGGTLCANAKGEIVICGTVPVSCPAPVLNSVAYDYPGYGAIKLVFTTANAGSVTVQRSDNPGFTVFSTSTGGSASPRYLAASGITAGTSYYRLVSNCGSGSSVVSNVVSYDCPGNFCTYIAPVTRTSFSVNTTNDINIANSTTMCLTGNQYTTTVHTDPTTSNTLAPGMRVYLDAARTQPVTSKYLRENSSVWTVDTTNGTILTLLRNC